METRKTKPRYGVGIRLGSPTTDSSGKKLKSYSVWQDMLRRCYNEVERYKFPSYKGCTVSFEWLTYENFKDWFDSNHQEGYQLDKDLLGDGKLYSSDTCCMLPQELNKFLVGVGNSVNFRLANQKSVKYCSRIKTGKNVEKHLGTFDTPEEALEVYNRAKKQLATAYAIEYYNNSAIKERVYKALLNF